MVKEVPAELLTTIVTEGMVYTFQTVLTAWTNREGGIGTIEPKKTPVMPGLHGTAHPQGNPAKHADVVMSRGALFLE